MCKRALIVFAIGLLPTIALAQGKQTTGDDWNKPYDFRYYDMMLGYAGSPGPVYDIKAYCFWGRARTSFVDFIIGRRPRHKFQVRDIVDAQLGVGYGKPFYANIMISGGMKFKYDINSKVDFGCNVSYRFAIDRIAYVLPMVHGFARFNKIFVEAGFGSNGNSSPTDNQRKLTNINVKYFFRPDARRKWSLNITYWSVMGRNNQVNNDWEAMGQYMIGVGFQ